MSVGGAGLAWQCVGSALAGHRTKKFILTALLHITILILGPTAYLVIGDNHMYSYIHNVDLLHLEIPQTL